MASSSASGSVSSRTGDQTRSGGGAPPQLTGAVESSKARFAVVFQLDSSKPGKSFTLHSWFKTIEECRSHVFNLIPSYLNGNMLNKPVIQVGGRLITAVQLIEHITSNKAALEAGTSIAYRVVFTTEKSTFPEVNNICATISYDSGEKSSYDDDDRDDYGYGADDYDDERMCPCGDQFCDGDCGELPCGCGDFCKGRCHTRKMGEEW